MTSYRKYMIQKNDNRVEAWSEEYIPFDIPSSDQARLWRRDFREELKEALLDIHARDHSIMRAGHASSVPLPEGTDIENVLFYNIVEGSFLASCHDGICFERLPEYPHISEKNMRHYYIYESVERPDIKRRWESDTVLASWENIVFPDISRSFKPVNYWFCLKKSQIDVFKKLRDVDGFGIRIEINCPKQSETINLSGVMKPMLDGVISAFQFPSMLPEDHEIDTFAHKLNSRSDDIRDLLQNDKIAVLGKHPLFRKNNHSIAWDPIDNKCVSAEIYLNRVYSDDHWFSSGMIFTVDKI